MKYQMGSEMSLIDLERFQKYNRFFHFRRVHAHGITSKFEYKNLRWCCSCLLSNTRCRLNFQFWCWNLYQQCSIGSAVLSQAFRICTYTHFIFCICITKKLHRSQWKSWNTGVLCSCHNLKFNKLNAALCVNFNFQVMSFWPWVDLGRTHYGNLILRWQKHG